MLGKIVSLTRKGAAWADGQLVGDDDHKLYSFKTKEAWLKAGDAVQFKSDWPGFAYDVYWTEQQMIEAREQHAAEVKNKL